VQEAVLASSRNNKAGVALIIVGRGGGFRRGKRWRCNYDRCREV
jgi:hypothetical protein